MPHWVLPYGQVISADELCADCPLVRRGCPVLSAMARFGVWAEVKECSIYYELKHPPSDEIKALLEEITRKQALTPPTAIGTIMEQKARK